MKIKTQVWNIPSENAWKLWKNAVLEKKSYSSVASQGEKYLVLLIAIDLKIWFLLKKKKSKTFTQKAVRKGTWYIWPYMGLGKTRE